MTIFLVIPVFNAEETLPPLLAAVQVAGTEWPAPYRALVVDDGSSDQTADVVADFARYGGFECLQHPGRMGLGRALRTGLQAAMDEGQPEDLAATLPAGDPLATVAIKEMLALSETGCDVVVGSRFHPSRPGPRPLVERLANRLLTLLFPIPNVNDVGSPYQLFRVAALQALVNRHGERWLVGSDSACSLEILLKLAGLSRYTFGQAPLLTSRGGSSARPGDLLRNYGHLIGSNWQYKRSV